MEICSVHIIFSVVMPSQIVDLPQTYARSGSLHQILRKEIVTLTFFRCAEPRLNKLVLIFYSSSSTHFMEKSTNDGYIDKALI